ncbi:hypothetical protein FF1_004629 [Malus domestica]
MVAVRDQKLRKLGRENIGKLVVYGSNQTHSALQKASQIVGIHPENFRTIETTRSISFALSPESLKVTIHSDKEAGLVPLFLCATMGTTAIATVDPLGPLCSVAGDYGMWVHVDAAYAGSACICPEFRHFLDGNPNALVSSLSTYPEFLRNKATESKQVVDYKC